MRFTYNGGTPQQVRWVQDAIAQCSFNLDAAGFVTVNVVWGDFPSNTDTRHPYMVTTPQGSGMQITIAPWADDPNRPENQGLPDPAGDIYEFYKQSFVHELGHVITNSTFNPGGADTDARIAQACALFWRPEVDSGPGRRSGTRADWDDPSLAWADEIREAVAEVFKVAFFTGRLIYMNRTNWHIDKVQWPALMKLWSLPVAEPNNPVTTAQDGGLTWTGITDRGGGGWSIGSGGLVLPPFVAGDIVGNLVPNAPPAAPDLPPFILPAMVYVSFSWPWPTGFAGGQWIYSDLGPDGHISLTVVGSEGSAVIGVNELDPLIEPDAGGVSGQQWSLVIWVDENGNWYGGAIITQPVLGQAEPQDGYTLSNAGVEIWSPYHHLGSGVLGFVESASFEITQPASSPGSNVEAFVLEGPGAGIVTPAAPYPLGPGEGEINPGPAASGLLLIGR